MCYFVYIGGTSANVMNVVFHLSGFMSQIYRTHYTVYNIVHLFTHTIHYAGSVLSSEVSHFTQLQTLSLAGCKLRGAIPPELGLCRQLVCLDLEDNNFRGWL